MKTSMSFVTPYYLVSVESDSMVYYPAWSLTLCSVGQHGVRPQAVLVSAESLISCQ